MKKLLSLFVCLCIASSVFSQVDFCGASRHNSFLNANANASALEQKLNINYANDLIHSAGRLSGGTYVIPVVFHIIHQNGPENVADSVLQKEIDSLNAWFANTAQYYNAAGANVNISFCLASVDPYGNPTTGITRDTSFYTVLSGPGDDPKMKNINRWNPYRYLNIWILRDGVMGAGAGAYSAFPWTMGLPEDGIVISYNSLGYSHYIITHEVGHYLGLYHTFEGINCINYNCLLDGDQVCDTPPEAAGNFTCNISTCSTELDDTTGLSPFTSDTTDLSNLMGPKSLCPNYYFTPGQAVRMNYFLANTRFDLLSSNGCGQHPGGIVPQASSTYHAAGCSGMMYISTSVDAQYIEWDTNNDGITDGIGDSIFQTYTQSGYYTVVMRVFNSGGWDSDTITTYVHARPNSLYPIVSQSGINWNGVCRGTTVSFTAAPGMTSYLWSTGDTTQTISFTPDSTFEIGITCVDSTGYTWTRCPALTISYPLNELPAQPILTLVDDSICWRDSFQIVAQYNPNTYGVGWNINNFQGIAPQDTLRIFPYTSNFTVYLVVGDSGNYCRNNSDTLHLYADPLPSLPYSPFVVDSIIAGYTFWHNQMYLDGVAIPGADSSYYIMSQPGCYSVLTWKEMEECAVMSDTVCYGVTVGLTDNQTLTNGTAYPNPSHGIINLRLLSDLSNDQMKELLESITIYNTMGQIIPRQITCTSPKAISIDLKGSASGMYIMKMGEKEIKVFVE
ncbi:MAG TPA: M43 family zinc metalloprotease [Bacteroidia bacterium]|nr:M43 family zinc metalloprotease [Bacteroidia bacterium]